MKIIWNQVTWYSKLLAVIFFLFTFIFAFKLGQEFEQIKNLNQNLPKVEEIKKEEKETKRLSEGELCFYYKQNPTKEEPYRVEEAISLNVNDLKITGIKTGIQEGPDMYNGYKGTLEGTYLENNEIELLFSYEIEGSKGE